MRVIFAVIFFPYRGNLHAAESVFRKFALADMRLDSARQLKSQPAFARTHDAARHGLADFQRRKRIRLRMLERQNNFSASDFYIHHSHFDFLPHRHHFRRMLNFLGPGHIGDVNESLNALRKHHKGAKRRQMRHFSFDLGFRSG